MTLCKLQIHSLHFTVALITLKALVGQFSCEWDILLSMARNLAIFPCFVIHLWDVVGASATWRVLVRRRYLHMWLGTVELLTGSFLLLSFDIHLFRGYLRVICVIIVEIVYQFLVWAIGALAVSISQSIFHIQDFR